MNSRSYSDLLSEMKNYMIANQSKITDFNDGSVIMTIFESVARVIERAYIDTRNGYTNNLRAIPYAVFDFEKKEGSKATVSLIFSRSSTGTNSVTIPTGTRVSDGTYYFVTTESGTIEAGDTDSGNIAAEAEEVGLSYNVSANTITTIESSVAAEIVSVTNPTKATGGADEETDTEMLSRFKTYINGLQGTNEYGLKAGLLAVDGVRSVGIEEHFPPEDDTINVTAYIDDGTGNLTDDLKEEVEDVINGDGTSTNQGLRACGVNVEVKAATQVEIAISVTCTIYRTEDAVAQADILEALQDEIDSLGINENVVLTSLILRLRRISYIKDVSDLLVNGSAENVTIAVNQIARFSSASITLESYS